MKKRNSSIDGFVPRRFGGEVGKSPVLGESLRNKENIRPFSNNEQNARKLGEVRSERSIGRSDIDESLKDIDESVGEPKKISFRERRKLKRLAHRRTSGGKRIAKWGTIVVSSILLIIAGYVAFKFIAAGNNIFTGSVLDIFQNQPLRQDENGRSNFLILGTTQDDPNHPGSNLTDSMMVVSIDQKNKNMYMFSIPRDLYVSYGMACASGYYGKINVYFSCSDEGTTKEAEQNRLTKTQKLVGNIFGLDIQYGIHMELGVVKEAVDAVGGIDVDIQGSNGAPGILDRNFDWRCNYRCYYVKYTNGVHHLDGTHAAFLAMARGDIAPTYGLSNSNFDREKNQQKILTALKEKAMTTGTLTNIDAVTKLLDSFGNNMRTNIKTSEIRTLMQVANDIKPADVHSLSLFGENGVFTTGGYNGQSVVMPSAGIYNYREIRAYIKKNLTSDPVASEAASVAVFNGTDRSGYAQTKADELTDKGYNITSVGNAPDGSYPKVMVYQIGNDKPATAKALAKLYSVSIKTTKPPVSIGSDVNFVVIFGAVF